MGETDYSEEKLDHGFLEARRFCLEDGHNAFESGEENENVCPLLEREISIVVNARIQEIREALEEEIVPRTIIGFEEWHDLNKRMKTAKGQQA